MYLRLTPLIKKLTNQESGNTNFHPPLIMQVNKVLIFLVRKQLPSPEVLSAMRSFSNDRRTAALEA